MDAGEPPDENGIPASGVAGRVEFVRFTATLDRESLPVGERVVAFDHYMSFGTAPVEEKGFTDLGLCRGIGFWFSPPIFAPPQGTTLRGCDPPESCMENTDIIWRAPTRLVFDLGRAQPLVDLDLPEGEVTARLTSTELVVTQPGDEFSKATVRVLRQDGYIAPQDPDEPNEAFAQRVAAATLGPVAQCVDCDLTGASGLVSFPGIPVLERASLGTLQVVRPAYYTVEVTGAEAEEPVDLAVPDGETRTVYFSNATVRNVRADPEPPGAETPVALDPLDEISVKEGLVVELSKAGPNHYGATEEAVQRFLEGVKATKTPEELEAVRRGILAERLVLGGARFAKPLIETMLGAFENLMGDLVDELQFKKGKALTEAEKQLKVLQERLDLARLRDKTRDGRSKKAGRSPRSRRRSGSSSEATRPSSHPTSPRWPSWWRRASSPR